MRWRLRRAKESDADAPAARRVYKDENTGKGKSEAEAPAARRNM
jgi:hypothetical protein